MKISKFVLVGFLVCWLLLGFSMWSAVYTANPETRVKAVFNIVVTAGFAVFFAWCLVEDIRRAIHAKQRETEIVETNQVRVVFGLTDPVPCPWCGYGPVSASQWGFCPDCGQEVYPSDVALTQDTSMASTAGGNVTDVGSPTPCAKYRGCELYPSGTCACCAGYEPEE